MSTFPPPSIPAHMRHHHLGTGFCFWDLCLCSRLFASVTSSNTFWAPFWASHMELAWEVWVLLHVRREQCDRARNHLCVSGFNMPVHQKLSIREKWEINWEKRLDVEIYFMQTLIFYLQHIHSILCVIVYLNGQGQSLCLAQFTWLSLVIIS